MQTSVLEWLNKTAEQMPDKIALSDENNQLSYKQYHDKSIGIARKIIDTAIENKKPVVVYLEKSAKMLVSFMGIAYSGNFYSPIDTHMPTQRVNKILEVLQPQLVITT
ncbi:MAG: AMP-binding protein, partial [Lachnospiraceae bacterium]|nr:AMP-binding protein [Lachnospiraceae bacterium]